MEILEIIDGRQKEEREEEEEKWSIKTEDIIPLRAKKTAIL